MNKENYVYYILGLGIGLQIIGLVLHIIKYGVCHNCSIGLF